MTYDAMVALAISLKGQTLETISGRKFTVGVYRDCPFFTPESTGLGRSDGRLAAERFLARFNEIGSYRPRDYQDVTRNASYFVAMLAANEAGGPNWTRTSDLPKAVDGGPS